MPEPTEAPATETADKPAETPEEQPAQADDGTDWKAEARKWEDRAKANKKAADELEKARKASMTEAERAVAEAEARGRTEATGQFGQRLARTEFDAAAARRNPDVNTKDVLEYVDLTRFVGEDGEPDVKAIQAAVERLVPAPGSNVPSFDGGARTPAPVGNDMNSVIRQAAGRR
jgi:hypothetical protein